MHNDTAEYHRLKYQGGSGSNISPAAFSVSEGADASE